MVRPKFKQRCALCKKNMVVIYSFRQFPICATCHLKKIDQPVEDPAYKALLDVEHSLYERSSFLRSIKESYLRFGSLTERQKEAFQQTVEDLRKPREEPTVKPAVEVEIVSDFSLRGQRLAKKAAKERRKTKNVVGK